MEQKEAPRTWNFFSYLLLKFLSCPMHKTFGLDFLFRSTYKLSFFPVPNHATKHLQTIFQKENEGYLITFQSQLTNVLIFLWTPFVYVFAKFRNKNTIWAFSGLLWLQHKKISFGKKKNQMHRMDSGFLRPIIFKAFHLQVQPAT